MQTQEKLCKFWSGNCGVCFFFFLDATPKTQHPREKNWYTELVLGRINDDFSPLRGKADKFLVFLWVSNHCPLTFQHFLFERQSCPLKPSLPNFITFPSPLHNPKTYLTSLIILAFVSTYPSPKYLTLQCLHWWFLHWPDLINLQYSIPTSPISCYFHYLTFLKSVIPIKRGK